MSGHRVEGFPHWLRDIDSTLPVTAHYIVHGNIRDRHLLPPVAGHTPLLTDTVPALWNCLRESGYALLLHHSPVHGLQVWPPRTPDADAMAGRLLADTPVELGRPVSYADLGQVLRAVGSSPHIRSGLVIDYLSQDRPAGEPPSEELHRFMLTALAQVHHGNGFRHEGARATSLYNATFWLVDRPSDLPTWMVSGSDGIRQVSVPLPDLDTRRGVATLLTRSLPKVPTTPPSTTAEQAGRDEAVAARFGAVTQGMTVRGMTEVVQLAIDARVPAERIEDSVRAYRLGLLENPWKRPFLRSQILEGEATLNQQVLGQATATRHAVDVLVRSTMGLTSAHQGGEPSGPRGVLFFAGPTGVGKTEMAKAIATMVFGSPRSMVRFDMSEFAAEHTEARLIGAPPGFTGHDAGGELTNAVRREPFSLLLFDEIEKAHSKILDKFLQILSDGRLTDGTGGTVHFSETVIVFTSNLGVKDVVPTGATPAELAASFRAGVRAAIVHEFENTLNRPELLGRIGDNIVVFDHLTPEIAARLASIMIGRVQERVLAEHDVRVVIPLDVEEKLIALATLDLSKGGRGVGLSLESCLVNPLGRELIRITDRPEVTVHRLLRDDRGMHALDLR